MEHGRLSLTRKTGQPIVFQYTDEHDNEQEIILSVTQIRGAQARLIIDVFHGVCPLIYAKATTEFSVKLALQGAAAE